MNDNAMQPKDFKIYIAFDEEVQKYYVAESEFSGLGGENADAGRLVSTLCDAAADLHDVTTAKGWNQFDLAPGQGARLIPVFKAPIPVAPVV